MKVEEPILIHCVDFVVCLFYIFFISNICYYVYYRQIGCNFFKGI